MKSLIKVMLILAAIFATTFILGRVIGILTVENVRNWLEFVQTIHPAWVAALVIALLFIDLFVAVPTLTITILAGLCTILLLAILRISKKIETKVKKRR